MESQIFLVSKGGLLQHFNYADIWMNMNNSVFIQIFKKPNKLCIDLFLFNLKHLQLWKGKVMHLPEFWPLTAYTPWKNEQENFSFL